MNLNRRRLLAAVGGTIVGASGYVGIARSLTSPERTVGVSVEELPVEATLSGEVLTDFTEDHPARIRFEFSNTDDRSEAFYFGGPAFPVSSLISSRSSTGSALLLVPDDRRYVHSPIEPAPERPPVTNCWRARFTRYGTDEIDLGGVLEPDESFTGEYTLLDYPSVAERAHPTRCLEPGEYVFEQPIQYGTSRDSSGTTTAEITVTLA